MKLVQTSDLGVIEAEIGTRPYCASWCDKQGHASYAEESEGLYPAADVTACRSHQFEGVLPELRSFDRIERDAGGRWTAAVIRHRQEPYTSRSGWAEPALVEFSVSNLELGQSGVQLLLTTGEVRVLAAQLRALCDTVDLDL